MTDDSVASSKEPLSRTAIVRVARRLLSEVGIEQMSLRRLAAELGVTAPALYAHVEDKGDLLAALAETGFGELSARYSRIDTADPLTQLRAQIDAYIDQALADPDLFRVMFLFRPRGIDASHRDDELPSASAVFESASAAVARASAGGQVHPSHDPMTVALSLWTVAHGLASVLLLGIPSDVTAQAELRDTLVTAVLVGLAEAPA